jgi:hypothetical protein
MARDEFIVRVCPYCGNDRRNFEVNVEKLVFSCWACGVGGTVRSLFYEFGLPVSGLPRTHYGRALTIPEEEEALQMPEGCEPVMTNDPNAALSNWAVRFLLNRGLTPAEMVEYGIQYTIMGKYGGRVVWPIYEDEELVYFVARAFMEGVGRKYEYPEFRRRHITAVYLGSGDRRMTLVLVEGVLQVPSIRRLGYSVMPLLGKKLTTRQMQKLQRRHFERSVVLLDEDSVEGSIHMARDMQIEGLRASWSHTGGPDSDELPSDELEQVIETAQEPTVRALVLLGVQRRAI